jgi:hypothetical protein
LRLDVGGEGLGLGILLVVVESGLLATSDALLFPAAALLAPHA